MVDATKAIVRVFRGSKSKVVFVHLYGVDDDPVVEYAREVGLQVVDIRLDRQTPEWDDFGRFDGHAGPVAHYNWFRKLSKSLIDNRIVLPEETAKE
jgi:hypothetical protein